MQPLTRQTFQHGSLTIETRNSGKGVWIFRWRELGPDGNRIRRKIIVGTKEALPTKAKAEKAAAALRLDITKEQPERIKAAVTVGQLAAHYMEKELDELHPSKAYSTRECYRAMIELHILPPLGELQTRRCSHRSRRRLAWELEPSQCVQGETAERLPCPVLSCPAV